MSEKNSQMKSLLNKFLEDHFSDCSITINESSHVTNHNFFVNVYKKNVSVLAFYVVNNSVFDISFNHDYYNYISNILGLNDSLIESTSILNSFIDRLNEHKNFIKIFKPLKNLDISSYLKIGNSSANFFELYTEDKLIGLTLKFNNRQYKSMLQFPFRFTDDNKLRCLPVMAFLINQEADFRIGFNLYNKSMYLITSNTETYEDFLIENKILNFDKDIDQVVETHVNSLLNHFKSENVESKLVSDIDSSSLDDKIALLNILFI